MADINKNGIAESKAPPAKIRQSEEAVRAFFQSVGYEPTQEEVFNAMGRSEASLTDQFSRAVRTRGLADPNNKVIQNREEAIAFLDSRYGEGAGASMTDRQLNNLVRKAGSASGLGKVLTSMEKDGSVVLQNAPKGTQAYNQVKQAEMLDVSMGLAKDSAELAKQQAAFDQDMQTKLYELTLGNTDFQKDLANRSLALTEQQIADSRNWAEETIALARESAVQQSQQFERYMGIADAQLGIQSKLAEESMRQAREYEQRMKSTFYPIEDTMAAESLGYYDTDSEGRAALEAQMRSRGLALGKTQEEVDREISAVQAYGQSRQRMMDVEAGKAAQDVANQFQQQRGMQLRQLAAVGVDPTSGRALGVMNSNNVSQAAASALAQNQARNAAKQLGWAQRSDAAALGRNLPGFISNATGTALGASQASVNTGLGGVQAAGQLGQGAAQLYGAAGNLSGLGLQGLGMTANIGNNMLGQTASGFGAAGALGAQGLQGLFGAGQASNQSAQGFLNAAKQMQSGYEFNKNYQMQKNAQGGGGGDGAMQAGVGLATTALVVF